MELSRSLIEGWKASLSRQVSVGGLIARNPTAHKWKAPFRSLVVREALIWHMHDLEAWAAEGVQAKIGPSDGIVFDDFAAEYLDIWQEIGEK